VRGHTLPYVSNSTELSRKKQNRRKVRRGSFFLGAWGRKSRAEIERERECVCVLIKRVQRGRAGQAIVRSLVAGGGGLWKTSGAGDPRKDGDGGVGGATVRSFFNG